MNSINRSRKILSDMQECFQQEGLPLMREREEIGAGAEADRLIFNSWCKNGSYLAHISATFYPEHSVSELSMMPGPWVSNEVVPVLWELFNLINMTQIYDHWVVCPQTGRIEYRSAVIVTGDSLDKAQFRELIKRLLRNGRRFYPLIQKQINSKEKPLALVNDFIKENLDLWIGVSEESS